VLFAFFPLIYISYEHSKKEPLVASPRAFSEALYKSRYSFIYPEHSLPFLERSQLGKVGDIEGYDCYMQDKKVYEALIEDVRKSGKYSEILWED
jgi:hypothetical protein